MFRTRILFLCVHHKETEGMQRLYYDDIKHIATRAAIRHWQRVGLLPDLREHHGAQAVRTFDSELLPRIKEIARLRRIGMSCNGICRYFEIMDKEIFQDVRCREPESSNSSVLFKSDNLEVSHAQDKTENYDDLDTN